MVKLESRNGIEWEAELQMETRIQHPPPKQALTTKLKTQLYLVSTGRVFLQFSSLTTHSYYAMTYPPSVTELRLHPRPLYTLPPCSLLQTQIPAVS